MATVTWTGPQPHITTWSGRWENTTAWIGGAPVAASDVVLPQIVGSGGYTVDVLFGGAARSLTTTGGTDAGTLRIRSGDFVLAKNGLNNGGGVQVFASASLSISGTAANAGMLSLNGGTLLLASAKTTLNGGGALSFASGTLLGSTGTETLTNVDNTLSGAGQIQALTLVNGASGVIEGEGGGLLLDKVVVSNSGVMEAAASGLLSFDSTTTVNNAKGVIEAQAGATLSLGGTINGGVLTGVAGSLIDVAFSATVTGATINNAGALKLEPGRLLSLTKVTLNNTGTVSLTNAYLQTDTVTLAGKGAITLSNGNVVGSSLTNVDNTISGFGTLLFSSNQKAGVIEAVGGTLFVGGTAISNAGTVQARGGGQINLTGGATIANTGLIQALADSTVLLSGTVSNAAKAVMQAETGGLLNIVGGSVANSGVIQAMAGATVSLNTGVTINNSAKGVIEAQAGATLSLGGTINGGVLTGVAGSLIDVAFSATVTGATINNAGALKLEPGRLLSLTKVTLNNTGTVSLTNAYLQTDTVTLAGKGAITLSNGNVVGSSLTNVDNTISGFGTLLFSSNQKAGVIEAVGGTLFVGGTAISNAGTVQARGGGQINLTGGATIANTGLIQALADSTVLLSGTVSNAAKAVMQAETGGLLNIVGGSVANSGVIQAMAGATVSLNTGVTINNSTTGVIKAAEAGATLSLGGTINAGLVSNVAGSVIEVKGPVTLSNAMVKNAGVLSIDSGASLTVDQSLQLSGKGHVTMASSGQITGSLTSATLTNVDNTIDGAGTIHGLTLVNQASGRIEVENGALTLDPAGGSITNAGVLHAGAGGLLMVKGDLSNASTAKLLVDWAMTIEGVASGGGQATVSADGVLRFEHAADTAVKFTGGGLLQLDDFDTFTGAVTGLGLGATLELSDINPAVATFQYAAGVLTVTDGLDTAHIHLVGSYASSHFSLTLDGKGGTLVGYA